MLHNYKANITACYFPVVWFVYAVYPVELETTFIIRLHNP